jgi:hypothetical protein
MAMKKIASASPRRAPFDLDIDNLLHPAQAFEHPRRVVEDPDLTLDEKRAILASWASDACAIEAAPALRQAHGTAQPVRFDDVMDALRALDQQAGDHYRAPPRYRRMCASGRIRHDATCGPDKQTNGECMMVKAHKIAIAMAVVGSLAIVAAGKSFAGPINAVGAKAAVPAAATDVRYRRYSYTWSYPAYSYFGYPAYWGYPTYSYFGYPGYYGYTYYW